MEIYGYIASIIIGITLGLMGGGGSILTVPVLVYLFALDTSVATSYSLFIVGITSSIGAFSYYRKQQIDFESALHFGFPSIIAVYITRHNILPRIPDIIGEWYGFILTKDIFTMLLFAILMVLAAFNMIKNKKIVTPENQAAGKKIFLILEGLFVGLLTGLVGAGGGFLIIPALAIISKLEMKKAIGTSLFIIAANSLTGFLIKNHNIIIDWQLLGFITTFAIIGIIIGSNLSKKIDGNKLKPTFGWFILAMGCYIIYTELF